jgi:hypothetical protein
VYGRQSVYRYTVTADIWFGTREDEFMSSEYPPPTPGGAWHPHPTRPGYLRWWDGTSWTEFVSVEGSQVVGSEADFPEPPRQQGAVASALDAASQAAQGVVDHSPTWLGGQPLVGTADQRAQIVCQFCQQSGCVTARKVQRVKRKTATRIIGGVATMGGSLALTGVSKKGVVTEMSCSNCGMTWDVGSV